MVGSGGGVGGCLRGAPAAKGPRPRPPGKRARDRDGTDRTRFGLSVPGRRQRDTARRRRSRGIATSRRLDHSSGRRFPSLSANVSSVFPVAADNDTHLVSDPDGRLSPLPPAISGRQPARIIRRPLLRDRPAAPPPRPVVVSRCEGYTVHLRRRRPATNHRRRSNRS